MVQKKNFSFKIDLYALHFESCFLLSVQIYCFFRDDTKENMYFAVNDYV